ncbi:MAG: ferrous iron transporter B [Rhodospirillaceae bacterium]|nr:ferrous iron transporter B [Rhodospirillaceae bacterium]
MEDTLRVALVGNPNSGKSSLFNALTGSQQKVGNYPGVTVERRAGRFEVPHGRLVKIVDLPGTYSLTPHSPDEVVTHDVLMGTSTLEHLLDVVVCVIDATNLRPHVRFALELKRLGLPIIIALNMMDLAARDGIELDPARLSEELGMPVIPTIAVRRTGIQELIDSFSTEAWSVLWKTFSVLPVTTGPGPSVRDLQKEARRIAAAVTVHEGVEHVLTRRMDAVVLNPFIGPLFLLSVLFLMFQAVFAWAEAPMAWIDSGIMALQRLSLEFLPAGLLQSLVVDGLLAGVGSVVIFLPQILILFAFILVLEASGYMARAAFLMDRIMTMAGLNGRAFIPLLSSFACAIPGIMAARTIDHPRDRLTTIMVAPLMTCAARLPVYTLIIAAFIPNTIVFAGVRLQGLVMFGLYIVGIVSALIVAGVLKKTLTKGAPPRLLMELPKYQVPRLRDLILGLLERARLFIRRAGTIILFSMIVLWGLASFPAPPPDATEPDIFYSAAGQIGRALEVVFAPIGFNWEISVALVPGMAAREVAVGALGTVYSLSGSEDAVASSLATVLQSAWSLPTALAFLAWYVFAPQCLSTLAVARRETNSWGWTAFMFGYLFALAYIAAGATYWTTKALM